MEILEFIVNIVTGLLVAFGVITLVFYSWAIHWSNREEKKACNQLKEVIKEYDKKTKELFK